MSQLHWTGSEFWDSCWEEGCENKAQRGDVFCFSCRVAFEEAREIGKGNFVTLEKLKKEIEG